MRFDERTKLTGPAGTAVRVVPVLRRFRRRNPGIDVTVAQWFLDCPGQSIAWSHYVLSIVHLRPVAGLPPAIIEVPQATHEVMLFAMDPSRNPVPTDSSTWLRLHPVNVSEQIELPSDGVAAAILEECAAAIVDGRLPAEPMLAGAVEPWHTVLIKTSAHHRGEEHAP